VQRTLFRKKEKGGGGNYFDLIASVPFLAAILIR
jgi:hypothetical protein